MVNVNGRLLDGKVVVISGATKGVGRDLAFACIENGAKVVIGGRDKIAAESILKTVKNMGGEAIFVETNLCHIEQCASLFQEANKMFGCVDGFVNYAGITTAASLLECTPEAFNEIMDINFKAAFFCTKYAVQSMINNNGGSIILVSSSHAWRGEIDRAAYACSKGALMTLSEHVAYHYAIHGVRCNLLTMGWTPTEGELLLRDSQGLSADDLRKTAANAIPMGRMQESQDYIAGMVYLLSDAAQMTTGSNLRISGGLYI